MNRNTILMKKSLFIVRNEMKCEYVHVNMR